MRIGTNARFLLSDRLEGIGWYSYQILKRMVEHHPEHEYIFFYDRKHDAYLVQHPSIQHVVISPPARHPLLWFIWFEWALPRAYKKYKLDYMLHPDGYCSLNTNISQAVVVHDLAYIHFPQHVPLWVRLYYQYFVPRQLQKATHIFAVSHATANDIKFHFPDCSQKISLAYNGVRDCFNPLSEAEQNEIRKEVSAGNPYFLFVGAIHPRKNVTGLIQAFELFKRQTGSPMKLMIVGRKAWHFQNFDTVWSHSPFKKDIIINDYLKSEELAKITASAFAVVQPSFLEGFGVPVLEALNCDVPVIISNRFSLPEVAGQGAYMFNPEDIHEMASQLVLAEKDDQREDRIASGRIHRTLFDWNESAECIYQSLLRLKMSS